MGAVACVRVCPLSLHAQPRAWAPGAGTAFILAPEVPFTGPNQREPIPTGTSQIELLLSEPSPCVLLIGTVVKYLWMKDVVIFEICFKLIRDGARGAGEGEAGAGPVRMGGWRGWRLGTWRFLRHAPLFHSSLKPFIVSIRHSSETALAVVTAGAESRGNRDPSSLARCAPGTVRRSFCVASFGPRDTPANSVHFTPRQLFRDRARAVGQGLRGPAPGCLRHAPSHTVVLLAGPGHLARVLGEALGAGTSCQWRSTLSILQVEGC